MDTWIATILDTEGKRLSNGDVICWRCQFEDKYIDYDDNDDGIVLPRAILLETSQCSDCGKAIMSTSQAIDVYFADLLEAIKAGQDTSFAAMLLAHLGNALLNGVDSSQLSELEEKLYLWR